MLLFYSLVFMLLKPTAISNTLFFFFKSPIDLLGEEHAAAWAEPAGSLCCSSRWQRQADAAVLGPCKYPERKGKPREAKMESSTGLQANLHLCWVRGFVAGGCDKREMGQGMKFGDH